MRPSGRSTRLRLAVAACALLIAPCLAPAADMDAAPVAAVATHGEAGVRKIDLSIGRSIIVDLPRDAKEVFVANPKVANAVVRSTRKVFIIGMADGYTSMFVMDAEGRQIAALDITVGRDLSILRETLRRVMPDARIDVRSAGDSVLLTGIVASPLHAQQAVDIANAFVGQSTGGGSSSTSGGGTSISIGSAQTTAGKVINSLTIRGRDQVMLKVTVAEMQRNVLKQLGVNIAGNWQLGSQISDFSITNPFSVAGQALSGTSIPITAGCTAAAVIGFDPNNFNSALDRVCTAGKGFTQATLQALERNGIMRTLAEPTLTAISGETAKFLVGGEVPLLAGFQCQAGICTQTIELKPFGVSLTFTPIVLSEQRISVRVGTEVSEIDSSISINQGGAQIPGFRVRRTETTVELPSGGSLVTAGLIQQSSKTAINGLPGLLNVPILGALFRSRDYQRQETELMISVTPLIAKPVAASEVARPDDGFVDASDPQGVLLGRLNKLYGTTGAPVKKQGYHGHVGFITD